MGAVKYWKCSLVWLVCFWASLSQAATPEHGTEWPDR
jgi:hypothetical protein